MVLVDAGRPSEPRGGWVGHGGTFCAIPWGQRFFRFRHSSQARGVDLFFPSRTSTSVVTNLNMTNRITGIDVDVRCRGRVENDLWSDIRKSYHTPVAIAAGYGSNSRHDGQN